MSLFREEIGQQPEVAARILSAPDGGWAEVARAIRAADPAGMVIAARGTSDHAAVYAKYVLEARNGLPVALAAPSLYTLYRRPPDLRRFCVLAISQAGASTDVVSVIEEGRRQGSVTVALTNDLSSPLGLTRRHSSRPSLYLRSVDRRRQAGAGGLVADSVHRRRGRRSGNGRGEIDASGCDLALGGRPRGGERRELRGRRIRDYRGYVSEHSRR